MHRIIKKYMVVFAIVSSVFLLGCNDTKEDGFQEIVAEESEDEGTSDEEKSIETERIFVHVCGAVNAPGVYEMDAGSRIFEAIEAAGGMKQKAAAESINQAEILSDGQQIYIMSKDEVVTESDGKVNINKASKEELMELPGIGESKADAIVKYRQQHGNFKSIEAIMEIEGIKEGVFHKIEDQITAS